MDEQTDNKPAEDTIVTDATLPDVTAAEAEDARKEGVLGAIKEDAAARFRATDGIATDADAPRKIEPEGGAMHLDYLLEMQPGDLKKALNGEGYAPGQQPISVSEGKVATLLEMERSGKNRTDIVRVLCDHLGVKSPMEVTNAGPGWTNPVHRDAL